MEPLAAAAALIAAAPRGCARMYVPPHALAGFRPAVQRSFPVSASPLMPVLQHGGSQTRHTAISPFESPLTRVSVDPAARVRTG